MTWMRFEERRLHNESTFAVTLRAHPGRIGARLSFNESVRQQVTRTHGYLDVFFDRASARVGLRFLEQPTDLRSYKITNYRGGGAPGQVSATGFLKAWGLYAPLLNRRLTAELKYDPAENLWWFSVAELLPARTVESMQGRVPHHRAKVREESA